MSEQDPQRDFATEVVQRLRSAGFTAMWAGGCVRDFLLERTPKDYDVATNATPAEVREVFGHRKTLSIGASFGVIIVLGPKPAGQVEVATFRTDGQYLDGRHPEKVEFSTPEEDAQRRDFTINGMFYDPTERKVIDFVGGQEDLQRRVVRAIGDPRARIQEDKLRMLRAVRFAANLDFELDPDTAAAIRERHAEILVVSAERIAQELRRMLVHRSRRRALELVSQLGMLTIIIPELAELVEGDGSPDHLPIDIQQSHECEKWLTQLKQVDLLHDPSFELVAASLFRHARPVLTESNTQPSAQKVSKRELSSARVICRRLRMSNLETDHIDWLVAHERELDRAQTLPMSRLKPILANRFAGDLLELLRTRILSIGGDTDSLDFCTNFLQVTPESELNPPPLVSGDDLIASGLKPGKRFKQLLAALRDRQLDAVITTKQQAIELAKRFVSDLTDENSSDE